MMAPMRYVVKIWCPAKVRFISLALRAWLSYNDPLWNKWEVERENNSNYKLTKKRIKEIEKGNEQRWIDGEWVELLEMKLDLKGAAW